MTVVMFETITLGLQRIVVFIFNLLPCATGGNYLRHVSVVNRQGHGKRILIQQLTVCRADRGKFAPVTIKRIIGIGQGRGSNIAIGFCFVLFSCPSFMHYGFNNTVKSQIINSFVQRFMRVRFAGQDEFKSLGQQRPAKGFVTVQIITEYRRAQRGILGLPRLSSQRREALISQSCFSWPSWGLINSGASGMTLSLPGLTSTGVTTVCADSRLCRCCAFYTNSADPGVLLRKSIAFHPMPAVIDCLRYE